MCMTIAAASVEAWLETQERLLRAVCAEAALDVDADPELVARWERHCRWLSDERRRIASRVQAPIVR
jgi:hypothetical protein